MLLLLGHHLISYFFAAKLVQSPSPAWIFSQFVNSGYFWKVGDTEIVESKAITA